MKGSKPMSDLQAIADRFEIESTPRPAVPT